LMAIRFGPINDKKGPFANATGKLRERAGKKLVQAAPLQLPSER
jgi:hypothetical protein